MCSITRLTPSGDHALFIALCYLNVMTVANRPRLPPLPMNASPEERLWRLQEIARARGGKCLSERYAGLLENYLWECAAKHRWEASAAAVVNHETWCLACSHGDKRLGIEAMREAARKRGGECLSEHYESNAARLDWRCARGHVFRLAAKELKSGGWCSVCAKENRQAKRLEKVQQIAKERGGKCLSERYLGYREKHLWECAAKHRWEASLVAIKTNGSWCPWCHWASLRVEKGATPAKAKKRHGEWLTQTDETVEKRLTRSRPTPLPMNASPEERLRRLQEIAHARGRKCLSKRYLGIRENHLWECAAKHRWEATVTAVVTRGTWCLACSRVGKRLGIEAMREAAQKRGGECLTEHYIITSQPLDWRCAKGHFFRLTANSLKSGYWCPVCAKENRRAQCLEKMREIAKERGGQCLSEVYINSTTKLLWQCHHGHTWRSTPVTVSNGRWCPVCAVLDRCLTDKARERYLASRKHKPVSET